MSEACAASNRHPEAATEGRQGTLKNKFGFTIEVAIVYTEKQFGR